MMSSSPSLRGCIGSLEPKCLHDSLADYALTSALNDKRFDPISFNGMPVPCWQMPSPLRVHALTSLISLSL